MNNVPTSNTRAVRLGARLERREGPALRDTGERDLFGDPILAPAVVPAPAPSAPAEWIPDSDEDEAAYLLAHACDSRPDPLPEVYFRPGLFEDVGQLDFFGG